MTFFYFVIVIKDYPERKSKADRRMVGKVGSKMTNGRKTQGKNKEKDIKNNKLNNFLFCETNYQGQPANCRFTLQSKCSLLTHERRKWLLTSKKFN